LIGLFVFILLAGARRFCLSCGLRVLLGLLAGIGFILRIFLGRRGLF